MSDGAPRPPRTAHVEPGRLLHYAADMTLTAAADVTLDALQSVLGAAGQWLPIDGPGDATVGALVALNSTGPLRLGYGAWRDLLLGVQFLNGPGELITAGGRTMKNVAGYDLVKLMVGQGGCLGELVTITMRTYRRPEGALLAEFAGDENTFSALFAGDCRPQWALLSADGLYCGYLGDDRALQFYETALRAHGPRALQRHTLDDDQRWRREHWALAARPVWRVSVPPACIRAFVAEAGSPAGWVADPAFGIVLLNEPPPASAHAVRAEPGQVPQWSTDDPAQRSILAQLKKAFDPHNRLPPLPFA